MTPPSTRAVSSPSLSAPAARPSAKKAGNTARGAKLSKSEATKVALADTEVSEATDRTSDPPSSPRPAPPKRNLTLVYAAIGVAVAGLLYWVMTRKPEAPPMPAGKAPTAVTSTPITLPSLPAPVENPVPPAPTLEPSAPPAATVAPAPSVEPSATAAPTATAAPVETAAPAATTAAPAATTAAPKPKPKPKPTATAAPTTTPTPPPAPTAPIYED